MPNPNQPTNESDPTEKGYIKESSVHQAKALGKGYAQETFREGREKMQRLTLKEGVTLTPQEQQQVDRVQKTIATREEYWEWAEKIGKDYEWFEDTFELSETYAEMDNDEQADLMFQIHSLVAQRKDLLSDIHDIEYEQKTGKKLRGQTISVEPKEDARDISPEELKAFMKIRGTSLRKHHELAKKLGRNIGWFLENFDQRVNAEKSKRAVISQSMRNIPGARNTRIPVQTESSRDTSKELQDASEKVEEVNKQFEKLGQVPGLSEAYANKITRAYFVGMGAQRREELLQKNQYLSIEADELVQQAMDGPQGALTGADSARLKEILRMTEDNSNRADALDKSEEGHAIVEHNLIKEYSEAVSAGHMVEFPSAQAIVDDGLEKMRNHQNFMLAGHLGSGKTQLLRHISKKFMIENAVDYDPNEIDWDDPEKLAELYNRLEPEIFSGSEEASIYDLIGKLKLSKETASDDAALKRSMDKTRKQLIKAGVKNVPNEKIASILLGKEDHVETVFSYGPLGRAIRDGRPIIIDEINMIPPEVLGRLNAIILTKPGDKIRLQENGEEEFTIKPGLTFLATLNLGEKYAGIKEVNAAFKSRWISKELDYPSAAETFDLMTSSLVRKDRLTFPPDFPQNGVEKMTDLTMAVREIQENFSGETAGMSFMAMARGSSEAEPANLEQAVISTRDLMEKILKPWKRENFRVKKEGIYIPEKTITQTDDDGNETKIKIDERHADLDSLDLIIAKNIVASEIFSIQDQKFILEIFLRRGFFEGWTANNFHTLGIKSITEKEIKTLQAEMGTDEYASAMKDVSGFAEEIETSNTSLVGARNLLIGAYNTKNS